MAKGKGKGSQWERDVSKYLTNWLTNQKSEYYFWRSPGSGSVATISGTNPSLHGDIIPLKPEAEKICSKLIFECKNGYPSTSLDNHLKNNKNDPLKSFWLQVYKQAYNECSKYPILIYKKKGYKDPWVGINSVLHRMLYYHLSEMKYVCLYWEDEQLDLILFNMKQFFDNITPQIIEEKL